MSIDDARKAIKLADGSYLIRTGCCRPAYCAPGAGLRCCFSARCVCEFPVRASAPVPAPDDRWPVRGRYLFLAGISAVSSGIVIATVIVIAMHIVAVLAATGVALVLLAGVVYLRRGRGPKYTVNNYYR